MGQSDEALEELTKLDQLRELLNRGRMLLARMKRSPTTDEMDNHIADAQARADSARRDALQRTAQGTDQ